MDTPFGSRSPTGSSATSPRAPVHPTGPHSDGSEGGDDPDGDEPWEEGEWNDDYYTKNEVDNLMNEMRIHMSQKIGTLRG